MADIYEWDNGGTNKRKKKPDDWQANYFAMKDADEEMRRDSAPEGEAYLNWMKNRPVNNNNNDAGNNNPPSYLQGIGPYVSPYAGATFNYGGGARPTFNYGASGRPTWQYNVAPMGAFQYDESGKPGAFQYDKAAPEYAGKYDDQINQMVDQILNRGPFEYDYNQDPLYQMYAESYGRSGREAMENTLAQVSARTGGLASSYAGTAAQNAYNSYMQQLNDKIPQLYQMAYEMYRNEGDDMRDNLGLVQGLDSRDYGRFQDELSQWNTDRNLAYSQHRDTLDQWNADRDMAYRAYSDELDQWNRNRDFAYKNYLTDLDNYESDRNWAYKGYQDALNQYNDDRDFNYKVWKDDISRKESAAQANYKSQVDWAKAMDKDARGTVQTAFDSPTKGEENVQEKARVNSYSLKNADRDTGSVSKVEVAPGTYVYEFGGVKYNPSSDAEVENLLDRINHMPISDQKKMSLANELKRLGANISVN